MANNVSYDLQAMKTARSDLQTNSGIMKSSLSNVVEAVNAIKSVWVSDDVTTELSNIVEKMSTRFEDLNMDAQSFIQWLDKIITNYTSGEAATTEGLKTTLSNL